jgi:prepilin-type N-terminal cleavage/methylation domain-containing protein/prepilin-type processing-associated H-X9-DG protein
MRPRTIDALASKQGFTLIELLAVIAIVAVLAGLIMVTLGKSRNLAYQSKCLGSLRSTYTATQLYAADNKGTVVPGSTESQGVAGSTEFWSSKLVPYYGQVNNSASATFACPKWEDDKVSATAYNWGYAINLTPGYEGASSTSAQKGASVVVQKPDGSTTGSIFRFNTITYPSRRLFFCDSNQWQVRASQVVPNDPGHTLAAYSRHGGDKCNVIFFDGHTATLTPTEVDKAIYDPGSL